MRVRQNKQRKTSGQELLSSNSPESPKMRNMNTFGRPEMSQRRRTRSTTAKGLGLGMGMHEAAMVNPMAAVAPRLALKPRNSIECSEEVIRDDGKDSSVDDRTETV